MRVRRGKVQVAGVHCELRLRLRCLRGHRHQRAWEKTIGGGVWGWGLVGDLVGWALI